MAGLHDSHNYPDGTEGTATVEITYYKDGQKEHGEKIHGCIVKNDENLKSFIDNHIKRAADKNNLKNTKYFFYTTFDPVFEKEKIIKAKVTCHRFHKSRPKSCKPTTSRVHDLFVKVQEHMFLPLNFQNFNKSKFLKNHSKMIQEAQNLTETAEIYVLGNEKGIRFIPLTVKHQSLNVYSIDAEYHKSKGSEIKEKEAIKNTEEVKNIGPVLLADKNAVVGSYEKMENDQLSISIFGINQGQISASHTDGGISGYETGQPTDSSLSATGAGTGQTEITPQPTPGDGAQQQNNDLSYQPAHYPTEEQGQISASHTDGGISGYETGQPTDSSLSATGAGTGQTGGTPQPAPGGGAGQTGGTPQPTPGGGAGQTEGTPQPAPGGGTGQTGGTPPPAPGDGTGQTGGTPPPAPGGGAGQTGGIPQPAPGGGAGQTGGTLQPTTGAGTGQTEGTLQPTTGAGTGQTGGTPQPAPGGGAGQRTLADLFRRKSSVLDGLSLRLDIEYRITKNWRNLADLLDAPTDVKNRCQCSTRHSPTELLLEVPKVSSVTIAQLLQKLEVMRRNDVARKIKEKISEADRNKRISEALLHDNDLCDEVAQLLDKDCGTLNNNWFKLGQTLDVPKDDLKQIERGNNPANKLFLYAYHTLEPEKLKAGYFRSLIEEFHNRKDVEEFLDALGITLQDGRSIKEVFSPESDNLRKLCALLNINAGGTLKDWKHLASAWKIKYDIYNTFDESGNKPKPTKILLEEWLIQEHENFTVEELCTHLGQMRRNDVREYLENEARI